MNQGQQAVTLTDNAVARVRSLMDRADKPVLGLRVGVSNTGCSGHSYVVEYAEDKRPFEEEVEQDGVRVFIDPVAVMFLVGSKMDYVEGKLQSGFVFDNPNEKGRCGCGESFHV
ncbi:MAG: iron-sulfur cluster assembly accessory protein [Rhodospirillales bacterium]|nr:iron-sulfur cluster assembly accessory protein [Rhodospirillales bacterium]